MRVEGTASQDHPPREVEGELGVEVANQPRATSAASSRAFRRFLPSYQKRAVWTTPYTVTRLDQAVRPPISAVICQIQPSRSMEGSRPPSGPAQECSPRLSEKIWKVGRSSCHSTQVSIYLSVSRLRGFRYCSGVTGNSIPSSLTCQGPLIDIVRWTCEDWSWGEQVAVGVARKKE